MGTMVSAQLYAMLTGTKGNRAMNENLKDLSAKARRLPPSERAALIEALLASLDAPDARIDALWAEEAERRLAATGGGEMPARDAADVLKDLRAKHGA
jgi:putative addiction module component (TIGR02574 family)